MIWYIILGIVIGIPIGVIISVIVADIAVKKQIKKAQEHTRLSDTNGFSIELLACPHCGSNCLELLQKEISNKPYFAIRCNGCGTQTMYFDTAVNLVKTWNARMGVQDNFK